MLKIVPFDLNKFLKGSVALTTAGVEVVFNDYMGNEKILRCQDVYDKKNTIIVSVGRAEKEWGLVR